jgi:hypothetical protein
VIRRWRERRARRLAARLLAWVGISDLTKPELLRVATMRRDGRTAAFAADRIEAGRARRRIGERAGMFALDSTLPHGRRS